MRLLFALASLFPLVSHALATETGSMRATAWVKAATSEARLILPAQTARGEVIAGIEIRLPADAKTYWRTAGETGVPPTFEFNGSSGVGAPIVQFPAPTAFDDGAGGIAYGYIGHVIFPVRLLATDGAATVKATVDYGVCLKNMCVPAQVHLSGAFGSGSEEVGLAEAVQRARSMVPAPVALASDAPRAVRSASGRIEGETAIVLLDVKGADAQAQVFVESSDTFAVKHLRDDAGSALFEARATRPASDLSKPWGAGLITLRTANGAIETPLDLDAILKR